MKKALVFSAVFIFLFIFSLNTARDAVAGNGTATSGLCYAGYVAPNNQAVTEIEAGMALAGLQLQANALGLQWQKVIISNPDDPKYRRLFNLDSAEQSINSMAKNLVNLPKNEKLSLKGHLVPTVLFFLQ